MDDRQTWKRVGDFIRSQRELAQLSLRQLAVMAKVSNPYLSQIERGVYRPSAHVLKSIADALHISAESLYAQAGLLDREQGGGEERANAVERAIRLDPRLTPEQKRALIGVYKGFLGKA